MSIKATTLEIARDLASIMRECLSDVFDRDLCAEDRIAAGGIITAFVFLAVTIVLVTVAAFTGGVHDDSDHAGQHGCTTSVVLVGKSIVPITTCH